MSVVNEVTASDRAMTDCNLEAARPPIIQNICKTHLTLCNKDVPPSPCTAASR